MNNNSHYLLLVNLPSPNLHIITQTKNPTNVGLDVVAFLPNPFNSQLYLNIFIYNMI